MKPRTVLPKFKVLAEGSPISLNSIQQAKTADSAILKGKIDARKLCDTGGITVEWDKIKWAAQEI